MAEFHKVEGLDERCSRRDVSGAVRLRRGSRLLRTAVPLLLALIVAACGAASETVSAGQAAQPALSSTDPVAPGEGRGPFGPPLIDPTLDAATQCGALVEGGTSVRSAQFATALDLGAAIGLFWQVGGPVGETRSVADAARLGLGPIISNGLDLDERLVICELEGNFAMPAPQEFAASGARFSLYGIRSTGESFVVMITAEMVMSPDAAGADLDEVGAAVRESYGDVLAKTVQLADPELDEVEGE